MANYANPQNLNRYSYVVNNPLKYTDPTGHMQASDDYQDSDGQCGKDDKGCNDITARIRKKKDKGGGGCGQSRNYSPKCPDWHFYTGTHMVCPAEFECTVAEMRDYLSRYAFPGQDHSFPVVDGQVYPILITIPKTPYGFGLGNFPGQITVSVSENGLMSVNQTIPGHIFHDGQAVRRVYQSDNGNWYVSTYSYGNNYQYHTAGINNMFGPGIFASLDTEMAENIAAHH